MVLYFNMEYIVFLIPLRFLYLSLEKGQAEPVAADSLTKELLDTNKCSLLDCVGEIYVWMGRSTSLDERKAASGAAEVYFHAFIILTLLTLIKCIFTNCC